MDNLLKKSFPQGGYCPLPAPCQRAITPNRNLALCLKFHLLVSSCFIFCVFLFSMLLLFLFLLSSLVSFLTICPTILNQVLQWGLYYLVNYHCCSQKVEKFDKKWRNYKKKEKNGGNWNKKKLLLGKVMKNKKVKNGLICSKSFLKGVIAPFLHHDRGP